MSIVLMTRVLSVQPAESSRAEPTRPREIMRDRMRETRGTPWSQRYWRSSGCQAPADARWGCWAGSREGQGWPASRGVSFGLGRVTAAEQAAVAGQLPTRLLSG